MGVRADEDFLGDVIGVFTIAQQPRRIAVDGYTILVVDGCEQRLFLFAEDRCRLDRKSVV